MPHMRDCGTQRARAADLATRLWGGEQAREKNNNAATKPEATRCGRMS